MSLGIDSVRPSAFVEHHAANLVVQLAPTKPKSDEYQDEHHGDQPPCPMNTPWHRTFLIKLPFPKLFVVEVFVWNS